jgi:hypothetical protein
MMCNQLIFSECSFFADQKGVSLALEKFAEALMQETPSFEWQKR